MTEDKINHQSASDLRNNGICLFPFDVDEDTCAEAIQFILEANLNTSPMYDHLTLIINSHGGSLFAGFGLLDVMAGSRLPVNTVGIGIIASMGLLIFMNGKHRVLTPNSLVMSHQWWGVSWGKEHELLASQKKNDLVSKMVINHYRKHSNLKTEKEVRKYLLPESDVWLTAEDCLKYGICDEIKLL
jgi:ATP-dependent Clp protease protease subunit